MRIWRLQQPPPPSSPLYRRDSGNSSTCDAYYHRTALDNRRLLVGRWRDVFLDIVMEILLGLRHLGV